MNTHKIEHDEPDVRQFLLDLRIKVLNITIEELITQMNWPDDKYYCQIVNGYKHNNKKKYKNPTVHYLFKGINYAIRNYSNWLDNKIAIDELLHKHIIKY